MRQHIIPECPQCHGTGGVSMGEAHGFPCSSCAQRWRVTFCHGCEQPLPAAPVMDTVRYGVGVRLCSEACGEVHRARIRASWTPLVTWERGGHG